MAVSSVHRGATAPPAVSHWLWLAFMMVQRCVDVTPFMDEETESQRLGARATGSGPRALGREYLGALVVDVTLWPS